MKLKKIKNRKELDDLFKQISDQGFGYLSSYDAHRNKINSITSAANVLGVSDRGINDLIDNNDTYLNISKKLKKHFSKFSNDDKIIELLNQFYLIADSTVYFPSGTSTKKQILDWIKFKKKYKIPKDPKNQAFNVIFYNFDKNFIKIRDYSYSWRDFKYLYKLLYNKEPNIDVGNSPGSGKWINLGEIEIKYFQNGTMNIKGNIEKLKKLYYKSYAKNTGVTRIVKKNNEYRYYDKN
jgi:hypothetical protein